MVTKEVLAKELKVGDIVTDLPIDKNGYCKFEVVETDPERDLLLLKQLEGDYTYSTTIDEVTPFTLSFTSPWYQVIG